MSNLQLCVDGSRVLPNGKLLQSFGWGLVAQHDGEHHERAGCVVDKVASPLTGFHEHIAFVNAVLYAREKGFDFARVTIVCDDGILGYGHEFLHEQNYQVSRRDQVLGRLKTVVDNCFDAEAFELTLKALREARIVKIKGHQQDVYQERADYLAGISARRGASLFAGSGVTDKPMEYEHWLTKGFAAFEQIEPGTAGVRKIWHPPFVKAGKPLTKPPSPPPVFQPGSSEAMEADAFFAARGFDIVPSKFSKFKAPARAESAQTREEEQLRPASFLRP